jgi:hypothetical protein
LGLYGWSEAPLAAEAVTPCTILEAGHLGWRHLVDCGGGQAKVGSPLRIAANLGEVRQDPKRGRKVSRWSHRLGAADTGTASCGAGLLSVGSFAAAHAPMPPCRTQAR